ncbi:hypothetical protein J7F02_33610 [Streptomyces sp. ISL-112]|uniref:hypothetical protein n=1 Tax=unclassified Streptomyces TaxID=2593676 RepID=UPI001BE50131|nr:MULTISPECIES: hypothetical protein [unclassified Streptomyces]MBT2430392.1 hypothetical protein [Streptomyces sp. ISL-112]MBT2465797.1 hypothetical protein [Streptomyces sp. ISL-63]
MAPADTRNPTTAAPRSAFTATAPDTAERAAQRPAEDVAAGTVAEAETSRARGLFRRRG